MTTITAEQNTNNSRIVMMANQEVEAIKAGDRTGGLTMTSLAIREGLIKMTWAEYEVIYNLRYKPTTSPEAQPAAELPSVEIPVWVVATPKVTIWRQADKALICRDKSTDEALPIVFCFPPDTLLIASIDGEERRDLNKGDVMKFMDEKEFPGMKNL